MKSLPTLLAFVSAALTSAPGARCQSALFSVFGDSPGDQLGVAVAGVGDVDGDGVGDFAAGAFQDDDNGVDAGRVTVYSGATGALLHAFVGDSPGDHFGRSVAGAGDVNRDGYADVIVGAPLDDNGGSESGSAKVFSGLDGSVLFTFDGPGDGAELGWSVSTAGDVNLDGHADVIVGAPQTRAGGAWVYSGSDGQVLHGFGGDGATDAFGWSVAGGGDVDLDGYPDLVVGAPLDDNGPTDSGSARAFSGLDGSVLFTRNGGGFQDNFGFSVAIAADLDGDGHAEVVVGANRASLGPDHRGLVRVFSGVNGQALYSVWGDDGNDELGTSLDAGRDVDGDGVGDLIAGARRDDDGGPESGAAIVVSGATGGRISLLPGLDSGDELGTSVGFVGDLDQDGRADVIVGSPLDDGLGADSGSARVISVYTDCNGNGVHDGVDIATGAALDCNGNGRPDACDLSGGASLDCNSNGAPDECDIAGGSELDCNGNGVPDSCDLAGGGSADCNSNGVPDECEGGLPTFVEQSPTLTPFTATTPQTYVLSGQPVPAADVTLTVTARANLLGPTRFVRVRINGTLVGTVFETDGRDCGPGGDTNDLVVPISTWGSLVGGGKAEIRLIPTGAVGASCAGSLVEVRIEYPFIGPPDCNDNGVPDECDIATGSSTDVNGNGVPDDCEFVRYCTAVANSTGMPASMSIIGSTSVSADDMVLVASSLPPLQNGLFIYSPDQDELPLGDGILCLGSHTQGFVNRLPFEQSDGGGTLVHALDLAQPPAPGSLIVPGSTWNFSCWFRDVPAGGAGFNFSDAVRVYFFP